MFINYICFQLSYLCFAHVIKTMVYLVLPLLCNTTLSYIVPTEKIDCIEMIFHYGHLHKNFVWKYSILKNFWTTI